MCSFQGRVALTRNVNKKGESRINPTLEGKGGRWEGFPKNGEWASMYRLPHDCPRGKGKVGKWEREIENGRHSGAMLGPGEKK